MNEQVNIIESTVTTAVYNQTKIKVNNLLFLGTKFHRYVKHTFDSPSAGNMTFSNNPPCYKKTVQSSFSSQRNYPWCLIALASKGFQKCQRKQ